MGGLISAEQAIEQADSRTDLSLRIRLATRFEPSGDGLQVADD